MPARTFDFPIDKQHAKRHNELIGDPVSYTHLTLPTNREV